MANSCCQDKRKLFCEISPLTYRISVVKCRALRAIKNALSSERFAREKSAEPLEVSIYTHSSLIRRRLGDVDMRLQENKAVNLGIAAPKVNGLLIRPGETFSFWDAVGRCGEREGYKEGLTLSRGGTGVGVGGGLCQFTNLIHWMVLHTPLDITEHHHREQVDLFPDFGRQIPFGTGTSVMYNYVDYRFTNNTEQTYQIITFVDGEYLRGELRAERRLAVRYHIKSRNERFVEENGAVYRCGMVVRQCVDAASGNLIESAVIKENHAKVMYDTSALKIERTPNGGALEH